MSMSLCCTELAPLKIQVERGQVSRVAPRPLKGAFLNITGTSKIDNKADYKYQLSNYGVDYVQFVANYPVGARFTVYLGAHAGLSVQSTCGIPAQKTFRRGLGSNSCSVACT